MGGGAVSVRERMLVSRRIGLLGALLSCGNDNVLRFPQTTPTDDAENITNRSYRTRNSKRTCTTRTIERKPFESTSVVPAQYSPKVKVYARSFLCFLHAIPLLPLLLSHRTSTTVPQSPEKKKEFSPCPLLPPLGLCRPFLAQTSTTPHIGAHRHRVRRSCAWSLETNRSRREPQSKGGSTLADLQQALEDYLPVLLGLVKDGSHLQYKVQFEWVNQEDDAEETGMSNAWYEVLSVLHLMAMLSLSQAN
ncbi:uncharacterized protein LOC115995064 [Quercus lobata]|uniref:uncharacterized protein LOC115995064 n=1 Tax=Quercus lobata TaxID=97700 RepID=UPI001243F34A|nr:uncharacterized protein LOC115995064 [Quercus lobata]